MKAVRYHHFGSPKVLEIEELPLPDIGEHQILVEVYATSVNSGDCHLRSGSPFMARVFAGPFVPRQKILGTTYSGKVVGIGAKVTSFKVGDLILGSLGIHSGTYCEYIVVDQESTVIKKPDFVTHEEGVSMIFGFLSAKYFLDKAQITSGMKILIIGAGGSVGSHAVQYGKNKGAEVHGICHPETMDFVYQLGADKNYDYTVDKLERISQKYDIIFDTVGKEDISILSKLLTKEGKYITTAARLDLIIKGVFNKSFAKRFMFDVSKSTSAGLSELMDMVEKGTYRPMIDSIFDMEDVVKAHYHFEGNRKKGALVLKIKK